MVSVSSTTQPVPANLYVVVGQGFNNVHQTVAEVRQYYTMFLAAMTAGNKVDIIYGWTSDPRPLIQNATIYKK